MISGAVLIYGNTVKDREEKVLELVEKIDPKLLQQENPDLLVIKSPKGKNSIGIAQIRSATSFLSTRPYSAKAKVVVIYGAHTLTTQAQNALLKTLEEPPIYSVIILSSKTETALLPTVLSRCRKFKAAGKVFSVEAESEEYTLARIISVGIGDRLDIAQEIAKEDKEEVLVVLERMVKDLRAEMLENHRSDTAENLKRILNTMTDIETTNVNTRLAIENIFINL